MASFSRKLIATAIAAGSLAFFSAPSASADVSPQAYCSTGLGSSSASAAYRGYSQYFVVNSSTINNVSYALSTESQGTNSYATNNRYQARLNTGTGTVPGGSFYDSPSGHTLDDIWGPTLGSGVYTPRYGTKLVIEAYFLNHYYCKGISFSF